MSQNSFDPRLELPPVLGVEYDKDFVANDVIAGHSETVVVSPLPSGLLPPGSIIVLDQIVRQGAGGKDVVDLIVEVEDMPGATEYEVRVSS